MKNTTSRKNTHFLIYIAFLTLPFSTNVVSAFELPPSSDVLEPRSPENYQSTIFIKKITFTGNNKFSTEQLNKLTKHYENRPVSSEELETLRQDITKLYINSGYVNSGAIIPNQDIQNGAVNIKIIEGKLSNIKITGNESLETDYLYQQLSLDQNNILSVSDIQDQIQIALQSPLIEKIDAQLVPGEQLGEAELIASIKEGKQYEAKIDINNRISPNVGEVRTSLYASALNVRGYADSLSANLGYAEGLSNYGVNYQFPLFNSATRLELYYKFSTAEIVEQDFDEISSKTWTNGFRFTLASNFTRSRQLNSSVGIERRYNKTLIRDFCISYSSGVEEDCETHITALRLSQDMLFRNTQQVLALRLTLSIGLDALGSTQNEGDLPSSKFYVLLGQAQFAQKFFKRQDQLVFRFDTQLSNDGLFSMEQFAVGGQLSVRGYRENQLLRDNGYTASIEYRITTPLSLDNFKNRRLQAITFFDTGGAWFDEINRNNRDFIHLSSAGLGFRWEVVKKLESQFYWAYGFNSVETSSGNSIQDQGIHFSLQYSI